MIPNRFVLLLAVSCAAAGCQGDAGDTKASAPGNVSIVENTSEAWTAESAWRIESTPLLTIGRLDGPAEYQLFHVLRALRLADGTIVVANSSSKEIRFYDRTGKHLRSVGRAGSGPGEYEALLFLRRFGADSMVVWDSRMNRLTVLALNGEFGRIMSKPEVGGAWFYYADTFGDGSLLGVAPGLRAGRLPVHDSEEAAPVQRVALRSAHTRHIEAALRSAQEQGIQTDTALLFRYSPTGRVDSIGGFFSSESYKSNRTTIGMPFGRRLAVAAAGDLMHYGSGETWEIRTYTMAGDLARIVRSNRPNPPLTRELIDEFIEANTSRMKDPAERNRMHLLYSSVEYPKTLPAFSELLVDTEGNLWAGAYHGFMRPQPRWTVFDASGRLLGDVEAPPRFTTYEIGADYVLGKSVDEFDVERVALHRLIKPVPSK